jgi:hypothetical protein
MAHLVNNSDVTQDVDNAISFHSESKNGPFHHNQPDTQLYINNISPVDTSNSSETKLILSVYGNDLRNKYPTRMGGVFSFIFFHGNPLIILGPQYYMSILLFVIVNLINALLIRFVYEEIYFLLKYIGLLIYILQVLSQIHCTLANPGIPHRNNYVSDTVMHTIYQSVKCNQLKFDKYRVCKRCNILVTSDQRVTHCEECNICVEGRSIVLLY